MKKERNLFLLMNKAIILIQNLIMDELQKVNHSKFQEKLDFKIH